MNTANILQTIRQCFARILPARDGRTHISLFEFVVTFIFSLLGDTKKPSLEGLRREITKHLTRPISRSSFWERLSRQRLFFFLEQLLSELMKQLSAPRDMGEQMQCS
jgi:hypothetical protein